MRASLADRYRSIRRRFPRLTARDALDFARADERTEIRNTAPRVPSLNHPGTLANLRSYRPARAAWMAWADAHRSVLLEHERAELDAYLADRRAE